MSVSIVERVEPAVRSNRWPLYYGWVNLGMAALAMTATLPGRTHGLGLITEPLLHDLHIDEVFYGTLNFGSILAGALFCLPAGRWIDRWGSRPVLTLVIAGLGAVVVAMSFVETWLALLATLVLVRGLGQGTLSVASTALVGKWFTRRLGLAMGVFALLLGIGFIAAILGVGQAVMAHGWRWAWAVMGWALLAGMAPLTWLLVRSTPEACGLEPESAAVDAPLTTCDATLAGALRTPAFWVVTTAVALFGLMFSAITLFNQTLLREHGFSDETFYLVMALLTGSGLIANLLGGWLATRWPLGRLLAIGMAMLAASLLAFPSVRTELQAAAYGLSLGVAGGLITVAHFSFYGSAYGRSSLGQIQGAAQIISILASALGPLVLAGVRAQGQGDAMFIGAAMLALVLGLAAWLVPVPRALQEKP